MATVWGDGLVNEGRDSIDRRVDEAIARFHRRRDAGEPVDPADFVAEHQQIASALRAFLEDEVWLGETLQRPQEPQIEVARTMGDYELRDQIGQGGMGVVYLAYERSLQRLVALKLVSRRDGRSDSADLRRFQREAETVAQLNHPNIVKVYQAGEIEGQRYFAMEYVRGGNLAQHEVADHREAAQLIHRAAEALHHAHQRQIVHRDLKPENILVDAETGQPRVTDFGLAKWHEADSEETQTLGLVGTPAYMSPEQARQAAEKVGPASDIYSLGATLYFLLVGRPPFQGSSVYDTIEQVQKQQPIEPRRLDGTVPRNLQTICLKCLAKEPSRRYATAGDLADDLERFLENRPIVARPARRVERVSFWCRRNPWLASAVGLSVLLLLAVIVVSVTGYRISTRRAEQASRAAGRAARAAGRAEANRILAVQNAGHAREQGERAEQQRDAALDLVDAMVTRVERELGERSGTHEARNWLFQTVDDALQQVQAAGEARLLRVDLLRSMVLQRRGDLEMELGRMEDARVSFQQSLELVAGLSSDGYPDAYRAALNLVGGRRRMGEVWLRSGDADKGAPYALGALELARATRDRFPESDEAARFHWMTLIGAADIAKARGEWSEAADYYREALAAATARFEGLDHSADGDDTEIQVGRVPGVRSPRHDALADLIDSYQRQSSLLLERGEPQQAMPLIEQSLALARRLAEMEPNNFLLEVDLAGDYRRAGIVLLDLGRATEARDMLLEARRRFERLVERDPDRLAHRAGLAGVVGLLGQTHLDLGDLEQGVAMWRDAHERLASVQVEAANDGPAEYDRWLEEATARLAFYELVLEGLEDELTFQDESHPVQLSFWVMRGAAMGREGRWDEVERSAEALRAITDADADGHYNAACCRARAVEAAEASPLADVSPAELARQRLAAVACLSRAIDAGFNDWNLLETDRDLRCLRETAEFQELIQAADAATPQDR